MAALGPPRRSVDAGCRRVGDDGVATIGTIVMNSTDPSPPPLVAVETGLDPAPSPDTTSFFGWHAVTAAFIVAVFGWGLGFYGPPVYLEVVRQSRGWPIALISGAVTPPLRDRPRAHPQSTGTLSPLRPPDRHRPRRRRHGHRRALAGRSRTRPGSSTPPPS